MAEHLTQERDTENDFPVQTLMKIRREQRITQSCTAANRDFAFHCICMVLSPCVFNNLHC